MKEKWKDIPGFEGLYQVSNTGLVRSFRKSAKMGSPDVYTLNPSIANNGYYQVTLYGNGKRMKFTVHRLVAQAFVPNPSNHSFVNHKDEDKLNNCADNLEWCDVLYNNRYGTASLRGSITAGNPVYQYLPTGEFIAMYASIAIASKFTGVPRGQIKECCRGRNISAGGYKWGRS